MLVLLTVLASLAGVEAFAQPTPESEEATEGGKILGGGFLFRLLILVPIAAVAFIAVWMLRKKRLIF